MSLSGHLRRFFHKGPKSAQPPIASQKADMVFTGNDQAKPVRGPTSATAGRHI